MDDLHPIAVLIEELKDEDAQMRLNSIHRLSTIALALGEERTRKELIPFLSESLDDEDEILLAIAEELAKFVPLVGGAEHVYTLLAPLETLAQTEETVVRDKAVETLNLLVKELKAGDGEKYYFPMVKRLAAGDWFASRASACGIFPNAFAIVPPATQDDMTSLFKQLCSDDTPMVRRSAASSLGKLAKAAKPDTVKVDLIPLFHALAADEQDTVRLLAVEASVSFAQVLSAEERAQLVLPTVQQASKDRSWRVRHVVADKWKELQEAFGDNITKTDLVPILGRLMADAEAEVRTQAAFRLPVIGEGWAPEDRLVIISTNIMPHVSELCQDQSQHVRAAIASVLMAVSPVLGKDKSIDIIVPLFLRLLKDQQGEVRLNSVSRLDDLQKVIGADNIGKLIVPEIVQLAEDPQWRVRLAVIEQLPMLAKILGADQFDAKLTSLALSWLMDNVYAIRESASKHVRELLAIFGLPWAKKQIIPKIVAMGAEKAYLARLTTLFVVNSIVDLLDTPTATKDVLPTVLRLAQDKVPNVRFNAARTIERMIHKLDKSVLSGDVKTTLETLKKDSDVDVMYYATHALGIVSA